MVHFFPHSVLEIGPRLRGRGGDSSDFPADPLHISTMATYNGNPFLELSIIHFYNGNAQW